MRELTDSEKSKIRSFGSLNYPSEDCLIVLGWDVEFFKEQVEKIDSEFNLLYNQGQVLFKYAIDCKLLNLAKEGDFKAIEMLEKRKNK